MHSCRHQSAMMDEAKQVQILGTQACSSRPCMAEADRVMLARLHAEHQTLMHAGLLGVAGSCGAPSMGCPL